MERFLVRKASPAPAGSSGAAAPPEAKRPRCEEGGGPAAGAEVPTKAAGDPTRIISWNVNGLYQRLQMEWSVIREFLMKEQPDVICLQEVRLPAAGPKGCKKGDGQRRRRGEAKRETKQEKEEWAVVEKTLLATLQQEYSVHWSLADWKYSGTAMLIRRSIRPSKLQFTLPALAKPGGPPFHRDPADAQCHPEGRVILASFESFDLLATYAPNNGNDESAFARRAAWDEALLAELGARSRPLVWIGDLNCAAAEPDVSHPAWFSQQCYQGDPLEMRGQPGFTEGERRRFGEIVTGARLVDIHRRRCPASEPPPADSPHYTWRGHPPVHQPVAKYHGKGMRIDYALVAEELVDRVDDFAILGHGASRVGFMGSDHCPIRLAVRPQRVVYDLD